MNRIRLLPEQVANQIAAGEVVERPASVVKELVENALDAEARSISVEIQAGGRSLIRVGDDGLGMSRDDALLCFERHATSKIKRAEDLSAIATMGFRGEAMPSIASVSRLTLTTRERNGGAEATVVVINGGRVVEVKAAGHPPGTTVEVRQLFFNLPARRKFLRSEETEYAHIHHYLTLAALAYPEVALTFVKDGRTVWQLPAAHLDATPNSRFSALRERLRALIGANEELAPVQFSASLSGASEGENPDEIAAGASRTGTLRVWGFIGKPGVSRATREEQHLFVNRRPIENRGLNFALLEGYHTALMKGRYPVCCLFLEIDPALVDINIHPAKREVKFHNERAVRQLVAQAVRQTLLSLNAPGAGVPIPPSSRTDLQSVSDGLQNRSTPEPAKPGQNILPATEATDPLVARLLPPQTPSAATKPDSPAHQSQPTVVAPEFPQFSPLTGTPLTSGPQAPKGVSVPQTSLPPRAVAPVPTTPGVSQAASEPAEAQPLLNVPLRMIGVIGKLYVLLESDRGLVLMDQHAAHERILFEQMLHRLEMGTAPSQRMLLPETIELPVRDAHFLRELLPTLNRLGVGLSEFGERTFLLDALPPYVHVPEARRFVLALLDELKAAGQEVNTMRLGEHLIAKTVCRHAVKAHDPLSGPELEVLLNDLRHCAMPYTCPHGRPTLIEINYRELEKKFGRTQ